MKWGILAFAAYVLLSLVMDAMILHAAPPHLKGQEVLIAAAFLAFVQILAALSITGSILEGDEDDAIMFATTLSFVYVIYIVAILHALGKLQWFFEFAQSLASLLASAIVAFVAVASLPASSAALALSLAYLAIKLRRGDYQSAAMMLFFAFVSALALLFSLFF